MEARAIGTYEIQLAVRPLERYPTSIGGPCMVGERVAPGRDPGQAGAVGSHHEQSPRPGWTDALLGVEETLRPD